MINEGILHILKRGSDYVSGEEISGILGLSRAGIWKHIQELRSFGYDITAVPHLGYRLLSCPDRLFPWEIKYLLKNRFIGRTVYYYESLPSTMDQAMDLALKQASEGALIIAEAQTRGRGRMGRTWLSPKYKGIYFSLIIRPKILPQEAPLITLISAVAICQGIKDYLGLGPQIKWPNDILLDNKKVGGILTELSGEMDMVHAIIVGVGINVNNQKRSLPHPATSLRAITGSKINRLSLLNSILHCLEQEYVLYQKQAVEKILDRWRYFSATLNRRIRLNLGAQDASLIGEAIDIDSDGSLLVRQDSGIVQRVRAGDIVHCKQ